MAFELVWWMLDWDGIGRDWREVIIFLVERVTRYPYAKSPRRNACVLRIEGDGGDRKRAGASVTVMIGEHAAQRLL